MTDKTNPRARLDAALGEMRDANDGPGSHEQITSAAVVACAEALSLLVDARLPHLLASEPEAEPEPEADPRESLPDETPVGHGWVTARRGRDLFRPCGYGRFTWWLETPRGWGQEAHWHESGVYDPRPATVGDLRRVGVPVSEWPDITAPEPEPSRAEQSEAKAVAERDNAIAALRAIRHRMALDVCASYPNSDARKIFRQSLSIVEAEARRRGIDLDEEAP